jgi:hypothetical protein
MEDVDWCIYGCTVYFVAIGYSFWLFGIFLECCTKKNLATLILCQLFGDFSAISSQPEIG